MNNTCLKNERILILSSENCYEGIDLNGDIVYGDYNYLSKEDANEITFSETAWDDEINYFKEFLEVAKKKYEERYNVVVEEVALCGKVGLWNRSPIGGCILSNLNPMCIDADSIDVFVNSEQDITIEYHHHDGTHIMGVYFVTDSTLIKTGYKKQYDIEGVKALDSNFFENLYNIKSPLKISKNNSFYKI